MMNISLVTRNDAFDCDQHDAALLSNRYLSIDQKLLYRLIGFRNEMEKKQ